MTSKLAPVDFYAMLCIPRNALPLDVKRAYHRLLLSSHPDKRKPHDDAFPPHDVGLLRQAYLTLSDPASRGAYDAILATHDAHTVSGPRPAQVVSLEEFTGSMDDSGVEHWTYACRCGGAYRTNDAQLEEDLHLIGCDSCSEVIWLGYEAESVDAEIRVQGMVCHSTFAICCSLNGHPFCCATSLEMLETRSLSMHLGSRSLSNPSSCICGYYQDGYIDTPCA